MPHTVLRRPLKSLHYSLDLHGPEAAQQGLFITLEMLHGTRQSVLDSLLLLNENPWVEGHSFSKNTYEKEESCG